MRSSDAAETFGHAARNASNQDNEEDVLVLLVLFASEAVGAEEKTDANAGRTDCAALLAPSEVEVNSIVTCVHGALNACNCRLANDDEF